MEETVDLSPYAIFELMERLEYADLKRLCSSYTGLRDLCKDPIAVEIMRKKKREMLERRMVPHPIRKRRIIVKGGRLFNIHINNGWEYDEETATWKKPDTTK